MSPRRSRAALSWVRVILSGSMVNKSRHRQGRNCSSNQSGLSQQDALLSARAESGRPRLGAPAAAAASGTGCTAKLVNRAHLQQQPSGAIAKKRENIRFLMGTPGCSLRLPPTHSES